MKKVMHITLAIASFAFIVLLDACKKEDNSGIASKDQSQNSIARNDNASLIFPTQAHMSGKTYTEWASEWWKWNLQFDCSHFPLSDVNGSRQNQNQSGTVFFLSGRRGNTLSVTVPHDATLFFPLITYYADSRTTGTGVEQSLTNDVTSTVDLMDGLSLTIDGISITNLSDYKLVTPMFMYAGNADLANCYDSDITGSAEPFVAGGYFVMLKSLSPGQHTIHRVGGASALFPFLFDITYNITAL